MEQVSHVPRPLGSSVKKTTYPTTVADRGVYMTWLAIAWHSNVIIGDSTR